MNNQISSGESNIFSTRTLVNFPLLTSESLISLIDGLNFKMGLPELRFCQNYFRNERLDNPTIHELKIIDRVYFDHSTSPKHPVISSFLTNDQLVADTYADLMARRRAVDPEYTSPCSLEDLLNILPEFFENEDTLAQIKLFAGGLSNIDAASERRRSISTVGKCVAAIPLRVTHPRDTLEAGDTIYAVLSRFNKCDWSGKSFGEKLTELVQAPETSSFFKKLVTVKCESVITALSGLELGTLLNTHSFENLDGCVSPFEPLGEEDFGVLAIFNKTQAADMLIKAQELGLRVINLGQLTKEKKIEGVSAAGEKLSLDMGLLKAIAFSRPYRCEADGNKAHISDSFNSVYINLGGKRYRMNSATCGGENYFMAGYNSVLTAYALSVSSGADETIGAGVYTLPLIHLDEKALGTALEIILGAYRAQCDLGIADTCPKLEFGAAPPYFCFHTLAEAPLGLPTKAYLPQTRIFYVEPTRRESGLPDIENLNALFSYVKRLAAEDKITAIYPTSDDLDSDLDKMLDGVNGAKKDFDESIHAHHGGFLLATANENFGIGVEVARIEPDNNFEDTLIGFKIQDN